MNQEIQAHLDLFTNLFTKKGKLKDLAGTSTHSFKLAKREKKLKPIGGLSVTFHALPVVNFCFPIGTEYRNIRIQKVEELQIVAQALYDEGLVIIPRVDGEELLVRLQELGKGFTDLDAILEKYYCTPLKDLKLRNFACTLRSNPELALEIIEMLLTKHDLRTA